MSKEKITLDVFLDSKETPSIKDLDIRDLDTIAIKNLINRKQKQDFLNEAFFSFITKMRPRPASGEISLLAAYNVFLETGNELAIPGNEET